MALFQKVNVKFIATILFIILHLTSTAKTNARPVYEVINEQLKTEDKPIKTSDYANLPYGNPLAGNSQQNAKLHAHNQQAMFNAERIRQHKAQSQRWMNTPSLVDNYNRAYHELQESHQLALEQQQSNQKEYKPKPTHQRESSNIISEDEMTKLSKADGVSHTEKKRNQRSYGSVEIQQYLEPKRYENVYISSSSALSQEIVKPNVINEMIYSQPSSKLYTEATGIPEYVIPMYYSTKDYQSAQEIETLNSLLNKKPGDQLSEFNALINSAKHGTENKAKDLEIPIDLYFYLKDPSRQVSPEQYGQMPHAQILSVQNNNIKDHTPIKEEVDEQENPKELPSFNLHTIPTQLTQHDVAATKSINFIHPKVTNQIISAELNSEVQDHHYTLNEQEINPSHHALQYGLRPTAFHTQQDANLEDLSEKRYLHHNTQNGVHHLTHDGLGVSAYKDENLQYAANYEFGYRVHDLHSGNEFGHQEAKSGEETNGHYHVLLPDGRMQNVRYSAGPEGFHADISYDHLK